MKIVTLMSLLVASVIVFASTPSNAMDCSYITKQILCVSYSGCNWDSNTEQCYNDDSSQKHSDATGSWTCSARSQGFDKHGYHYGSGATEAEAKSDALATCKAFHVATDCELDGCGQKASVISDK